MLNKVINLAVFSVVLSISAGVQAKSCVDYLPELKSWTNKALPNYIQVQIASAKLRPGSGEYLIGHGAYGHGEAYDEKIKSDYFIATAKVKMLDPKKRLGLLSPDLIGYQLPSSLGRTDDVTLIISPQKQSLILNTWNNTELNIHQPNCIADQEGVYMTGYTKEHNGWSAIAITLEKAIGGVLF